ncbi:MULTISPECIES: DUF2975 domain-containing protein [unclassified Streptomyces]|uniref:DUF2975 domain-containing protein n=1 Tax=unclassified Streptomyces TaxID=2593676 RepID=UPI00339DEE62
MSLGKGLDAATSRGTDAPARSRLPRALAGLMLAAAIVVPLAGIAYAVNGATQAKAYVNVTVRARALDRLDIPLTVRPVTGASDAPTGDDTEFAVHQSTENTDGVVRLDLPDVDHSTWLETDAGTLALRSWGSTIVEQLTTRGGTAVTAVCIGVGALLLRTLLLSTAAGRPFQPGNAIRITGIAALIAVAAVAPAILSNLSAELVLHRVGLAGANSPVEPPVLMPGSALVQLLVALLVLTLAEAFRRGGDLARDVEGLV